MQHAVCLHWYKRAVIEAKTCSFCAFFACCAHVAACASYERTPLSCHLSLRIELFGVQALGSRQIHDQRLLLTRCHYC